MKQVRVKLNETFSTREEALLYFENNNDRIGGIECYPVSEIEGFELLILMPDNGARVLGSKGDALYPDFLSDGKAFIGVERPVELFARFGTSIEDAVKSLRDEKCHTLVLAGQYGGGIPHYNLIAASKLKAAMPELKVGVVGWDGEPADICVVNIM
jgi:hypothetical protein